MVEPEGKGQAGKGIGGRWRRDEGRRRGAAGVVPKAKGAVVVGGQEVEVAVVVEIGERRAQGIARAVRDRALAAGQLAERRKPSRGRRRRRGPPAPGWASLLIHECCEVAIGLNFRRSRSRNEKAGAPPSYLTQRKVLLELVPPPTGKSARKRLDARRTARFPEEGHRLRHATGSFSRKALLLRLHQDRFWTIQGTWNVQLCPLSPKGRSLQVYRP
jgi:hypothetical protein